MIDSNAATATPENCSLRKGVCESLQKWSAANKSGHIVVVCESKQYKWKQRVSATKSHVYNLKCRCFKCKEIDKQWIAATGS